MKIKNEINEQVAKGNLEKAIELLIEYSRLKLPEVYQHALVLSCQLRNWNKQNNLGLNPPREIFIQVSVSITNLTSQLEENQNEELGIDRFKLFRIKQLEEKIIKTYQLIDEWEQKRDIAENPNEAKRSQIEIQKLKFVSQEYLDELNQVFAYI